MSNQIDITIKVPPLPDGYELYTGEGVPRPPYAALSHHGHWFTVDGGGPVKSLAYAVPAAKPKIRVVWIEQDTDGCIREYDSFIMAQRVKVRDRRISLQRITLYEGRYDDDSLRTPEEMLIEAAGKWVKLLNRSDLEEPALGIYDAYFALQKWQMRK
jgi:hypothetical protein